MPETKVVLLEQDDLMHANTGESNFNESAYYNFYDRGQRNDEIDQPRSQNGSERDRKQDTGKGENDIDAAHHKVVDSTAGQRSGRANQAADDERNRDDDRGYRKRKASAPQDTGENVAAERVATKRVRAAGTGENVREIDRDRIGADQYRTYDRCRNEGDYNSHSNSQ